MMRKIFFTCLICLGAFFHRGVFAADFVTGTDDAGVFYFPQIMAEWCSLNFEDEMTYGRLEDCFSKIAKDMNDPNSTESAAAKQQYQELKKEVWMNAFLLSLEIKQKYANLKIAEKAEEITEKAGGEGRTQDSGNAEIKKFILQQQEDLKRLREALIDLEVYSVLEQHSDIFEKSEESE